MAIFVLAAASAIYATETQAAPSLVAAHADAGVNMEGKEVRFGAPSTAIWTANTTGASDGGVNAMHDSFMPLGGGVAMFMIQLGEMLPGGVGSGLYGMVVMALIAVFVAGLMVGRTPEYLGKKLEAREIKLVALGLLITPLSALFSTSLATASSAGRASISSAAGGSPQGFSETFYAYLSQANNNGSAFPGYTGYIQPNAGNLGAHGIKFADILGGFTMMFARYAPILFTLAVAGALAGKRISPVGLGTMRTDNPTFVVLLIGVIVLVGALTFFPALLLGPIVQGLTGHLY
jgi:K+-transporting ATPase ATPase A chain